MQELGGKHKENFALLTRADDIVPRAFQHLARRLRKVYKDAGKDIWISLPIVREWTPEGTFLDPSSPYGFSPLPQPEDFPHDGNAQDCGSGCALSWASAMSEATRAVLEETEQGKGASNEGMSALIVDPSGFTGLCSLYVATIDVLDSKRLRLVDMDSGDTRSTKLTDSNMHACVYIHTHMHILHTYT